MFPNQPRPSAPRWVSPASAIMADTTVGPLVNRTGEIAKRNPTTAASAAAPCTRIRLQARARTALVITVMAIMIAPNAPGYLIAIEIDTARLARSRLPHDGESR